MKKLLLTLGTICAVLAPLATVIACTLTETEQQMKDAGYTARCNNGTWSKASGSGACSHNGGVDKWLSKVHVIQSTSSIELNGLYFDADTTKLKGEI